MDFDRKVIAQRVKALLVTSKKRGGTPYAPRSKVKTSLMNRVHVNKEKRLQLCVPCIYGLFSNGSLLYIGMTKHFYARVHSGPKHHALKGALYAFGLRLRDSDFKIIQEFPTGWTNKEAFDLEAELIVKYAAAGHPLLNLGQNEAFIKQAVTTALMERLKNR